MTSVTVLVVLANLLSGTLATPGKPMSDKLMAIIEAWAPLVWLHPEEVFFPSSVDFHFQHVEVRASDETVVQTSPDRYSVVTGPETSDMHLNSVPDLECADCILDWFAGHNVSHTAVPTYVFVRDHQTLRNRPYEEGCMDTHTHTHTHTHLLTCALPESSVMAGEESRMDMIDVTYPATVEVVDGQHAELFSANGSHGLWSQEGTHEYVHFPVYLQDQAARGYAWRTWNFLEVVNYDPDTEYEGDRHYLNYRGRWGNLRRGCEVQPVSGECVLDDGPGLWRPGPSDFPDDCAAH
ncbi:uncharacterized protein [Panulirus ornatus]|uniref:uncharacterized protein n=1 Tax=Panulirus ornatus TaxID=150431 RepID=UPI003A8A4DFE